MQELLSLQEVGQVEMGSQVSPGSVTPLSHWTGQSESLLALQPEGQQPSPPAQAVIVVNTQSASQLAALPWRVSVVHTLLSLQLVGQVVGGSQVSPGSR